MNQKFRPGFSCNSQSSFTTAQPTRARYFPYNRVNFPIFGLALFADFFVVDFWVTSLPKDKPVLTRKKKSTVTRTRKILSNNSRLCHTLVYDYNWTLLGKK